MDRLFSLLMVLIIGTGIYGAVVIPGALMPMATAAGGGGSPEVESITTNSYNVGASGTNLSTRALYTNLVQVTGANGLIFIHIGIGDADPTGNRPTSNTWGGTGFKQEWATNNGTGSLFVRSDGWYLKATAPGTAELITTLNGVTADQVHIIITVITNTHQTAPVSGVTTASGESTTPSVTVPSAANSLVISGVTTDAENTLTIGAGPTLVARILNVNADTDSGVSKRAGAATVAMPWSTGNQPWAQGGFSIAPP